LNGKKNELITALAVAQLPQNPIFRHFKPRFHPIFINLTAPDNIGGSATANSTVPLYGLKSDLKDLLRVFEVYLMEY